jgi:hypothetical protein
MSRMDLNLITSGLPIPDKSTGIATQADAVRGRSMPKFSTGTSPLPPKIRTKTARNIGRLVDFRSDRPRSPVFLARPAATLV